nr:hypothetical protein GCM10020093_088410 [Planobispora longispora]
MAKPSLIPAEAMSHAVAFDPQFRMPRRPRLVPGLVTLPLPDGLLVEGTPTRQALRGAAARTLIPGSCPSWTGAGTSTDSPPTWICRRRTCTRPSPCSTPAACWRTPRARRCRRARPSRARSS